MERGCACTQGQRTCTARRAGAGVDKGLSAIPLRCHPERSDTLKGTRGFRAPGKTLTFTDGPLHLRTGFFVVPLLRMTGGLSSILLLFSCTEKRTFCAKSVYHIGKTISSPLFIIKKAPEPKAGVPALFLPKML